MHGIRDGASSMGSREATQCHRGAREACCDEARMLDLARRGEKEKLAVSEGEAAAERS